MSDINASIQAENGTQQGAEGSAALSTTEGNAGTGTQVSDGYVPVAESSLSPSTASVATADASGTPVTGVVDGEQGNALPVSGESKPVDAVGASTITETAVPDADHTAEQRAADQAAAQAQFAAAMTPAYVALADQSSHPAHGLADQIAERISSLEASANSMLVSIAADVKKLLAQIKSVL